MNTLKEALFSRKNLKRTVSRKGKNFDVYSIDEIIDERLSIVAVTKTMDFIYLIDCESNIFDTLGVVDYEYVYTRYHNVNKKAIKEELEDEILEEDCIFYLILENDDTLRQKSIKNLTTLNGESVDRYDFNEVFDFIMCERPYEEIIIS